VNAHATKNHARLRLWNLQIAADLAGEDVGYFGVARNCGSTIVARVAPPRVFGALTNENTPMRNKMRDQGAALQSCIEASSKSPLAAARASSRFILSIS